MRHPQTESSAVFLSHLSQNVNPNPFGGVEPSPTVIPATTCAVVSGGQLKHADSSDDERAIALIQGFDSVAPRSLSVARERWI